MTKRTLLSLSLMTGISCFPALVAAQLPAGSDYNKDVTRTFVSERSGEALESVNSILCMIAQTKYDDDSLLNSGYYRALVDESVCEGRDSAEKSGDSSSGGTGASGSKSYVNWTVKSTRASATSPQMLTAFVHVKGPGDVPLTIEAKMLITEAASEFNPTGAFEMHFKGVPAGSNVPVMKGIISSERDSQGRVLIRFIENQSFNGQVVYQTKAALRRNTLSGEGSVSSLDMMQGPGSKPVNFNFAYNSSFFRRSKVGGGEDQCLRRGVFETSAWRYGLYNSTTGDRINVDGGFPINTAADGSGAFGYVGYYGLFLPPNAPDVDDGDSVYRLSFNNGAPQTTPYTLVEKNGKLKKHTRSILTLGELKNVPLEGMLPLIGGGGPNNSITRLTWNGVNLAVRASATQSGDGPPTWTNVVPAQPITSATSLMFGDIGLYSQSLGGQVRIKLSNCQPINQFDPSQGVHCDAPSASTTVVFYKESTVAPGDGTVPAVLTCYDNCPKSTSPSGMSASDPVYSGNFTAHTYAFAAGILTDGGNPATLSDAPNGQPWGFNSGPLFDYASNATSLQCPWDAGQVCPWRAWSELTEFYTWETGPNSWNKFTTVKDQSNNVVAFDPPKPVQYEYPVGGTDGLNPEAVDKKFRGNTFFLQYAGFGDLQGIPGKCFNPANPADSSPDCSGEGKRWVPEFTIPAGSTVLDDDGITAYLVKPLEVEQRMAKAPSSSCSNIDIVDLKSLWPNISTDWKDPELGDEPDITDPPKVIAGVIQE